VSCFRVSAPKAENGFVGAEFCFVGHTGRNIGEQNSNDFSESVPDLAYWLTAAINSGAGVTTGDPQ
jgi:hypothetical protein